jgi:hypothetical protein
MILKNSKIQRIKTSFLSLARADQRATGLQSVERKVSRCHHKSFSQLTTSKFPDLALVMVVIVAVPCSTWIVPDFPESMLWVKLQEKPMKSIETSQSHV